MHRFAGPAAGTRYALAIDDIVDERALARQIARVIARARIAAGLSQSELAARMATAQSFVARLESGRVLPTTMTLVKIANATGASLRLDLVLPAGSCEAADWHKADPHAS